MNGQDISLGFCKLKNTSYRVLMDYNAAAQAGFECAHTCEYIRERKRAINSKVTLMTYQLWLHYVNLMSVIIFQILYKCSVNLTYIQKHTSCH